MMRDQVPLFHLHLLWLFYVLSFSTSCVVIFLHLKPFSLYLYRFRSNHTSGNRSVQFRILESAGELITKEPYLVFEVLFIFLRMIIYFVPAIYSFVKPFWVPHTWHLNLRLLHELSQLLEQI